MLPPRRRSSRRDDDAAERVDIRKALGSVALGDGLAPQAAPIGSDTGRRAEDVGKGTFFALSEETP
jgi:hypothetical protein